MLLFFFSLSSLPILSLAQTLSLSLSLLFSRTNTREIKQMKAFFDATGGLWSSGALSGKPASILTSTASIGGGQESTILASIPVLTHHGMLFVPVGYGMGPALYAVDLGSRGGSPWGAGTLAGADGSRRPTRMELELATFQGKTLAGVARKLAAE